MDENTLVPSEVSSLCFDILLAGIAGYLQQKTNHLLIRLARGFHDLRCMLLSWSSIAASMVVLWSFHGDPAGASMTFSWCFHGPFMVVPGRSHAFYSMPMMFHVVTPWWTNL